MAAKATCGYISSSGDDASTFTCLCEGTEEGIYLDRYPGGRRYEAKGCQYRYDAGENYH